MRGDLLPPAHHIGRHCRHKDLIFTNGSPTGVTEAAFEPKPDETDGLSANWLEFFRGDRPHNVAGVRSVTKLNVKRSHRIAILSVAAVVSGHGSITLAVVEDPIEDIAPQTNAAHVLIKDPAALQDRSLRDALAFLVRQGDLEQY
jgi:hypothetical protein